MRKEEVIYQVKNELLGTLDLLAKLEDKLLGRLYRSLSHFL